MNSLSADINERFADLKEINFPGWITQPMIVNLTEIEDVNIQEEVAELQNNDSFKILFDFKRTMTWLSNETELKCPFPTEQAKKIPLSFPRSYLAECGFSAITDLLIKKRNRLDVTRRGDLRLKLTSVEPNIKHLCSIHGNLKTIK